MGKLNILKGGWRKSVGVTTGAKWKDLLVIKTKPMPSNPDTLAQQHIRSGFSVTSAFFALFAPSLKEVTTLDLKRMSVRNALMKLNKGIILDTASDRAFSQVKISSGTIPAPVITDTAVAVANKKLTFKLLTSYSSLYCADTRAVVVVLRAKNDKFIDTYHDISLLSCTQLAIDAAEIASNTPVEKSIDLPDVAAGDKVYIYCYMFTKSKSAKRSSTSVYDTCTVA